MNLNKIYEWRLHYLSKLVFSIDIYFNWYDLFTHSLISFLFETMVLESRVLLARLEKILDMMLRGAPLVALMSHLLIIGSLVVLNLMLSLLVVIIMIGKLIKLWIKWLLNWWTLSWSIDWWRVWDHLVVDNLLLKIFRRRCLVESK